VPQAVGLTDEILGHWAPFISVIELVPSSAGRFEVMLDGELIFSKARLGRHAKPGEIATIVRERIGPGVAGS
jgi:selenoprotein W-related protein